MQIQAENQTRTLKPIPNPRGTQTVPQPKPATPRSPDGRFAPGVPPPHPADQTGEIAPQEPPTAQARLHPSTCQRAARAVALLEPA
jgi:hypothetical protein